MFKNTAYTLEKYAKSIAINGLINDKSRFNFYKPAYSLSIYQKTVKRIKSLNY